MEYVSLSFDGLRVSRIALGTMTFGSQVSEHEAQGIVDHCLDAGINFFDTANVYNKGKSEEILGKVLGNRRNKVVVASKVRGDMGDYSGLAPDAIRRGLEESLRRLGTDFLDIYYLHQPDYQVPVEETLEAMEELRREGKIRFVGHSNYSSWQSMEMLALSKEHGWQPPRIAQPMLNLIARGLEQEFVPFAKAHDVSMVVYNPLAGGLLTGKQALQSGPSKGSRFDGNKQYLNRYWKPQTFDAVSQLNEASSAAGRSLLETSFRWLLDQQIVSSVLVGASSLQQLKANLTACEAAPLSEELNTACDEVWADLRGPVPAYNR